MFGSVFLNMGGGGGRQIERREELVMRYTNIFNIIEIKDICNNFNMLSLKDRKLTTSPKLLKTLKKYYIVGKDHNLQKSKSLSSHGKRRIFVKRNY